MEKGSPFEALTGTLLGAFVDRRFLAVPAVVTGFLLQHALPLPVLLGEGMPCAIDVARDLLAVILATPRPRGL